MRFAKIKAALLFGLGGFFLEAMIFVRRKMTVVLSGGQFLIGKKILLPQFKTPLPYNLAKLPKLKITESG